MLVQGVHSASWCTVLCGAGHMCGRGAPARCTHVARRARSTLSHIYSCVTVRDGLKLTIRPSYRTRLFDSKFSCLHAYTQLWKIKHKKSKCECDGLEGYRIFVTAACAAAAASAGLAPSCAKCCFWCGLGKMATRWQRHRPSQRSLLRWWLRWLCGGGSWLRFMVAAVVATARVATAVAAVVATFGRRSTTTSGSSLSRHYRLQVERE